MSEPHSHLPFGEDGSGLYSDSVAGCYDVINSTNPLLHDAIKAILKQNDNKNPSCFTIADFGTADGGTSMPLMYSAVELLKELCGEEQNVLVIYEDQATNDFKSLFLRLNGLIPGPKSFLKDFKNTFISAVGVSFYAACVPPDSYHLGFAATCLHWLRQKPCNLKNGIHHSLCTDPQENAKFSRQAALDWEDILMLRANEMKTGGRFVMAQFCIDENGYHLGNTSNAKYSMYKVMNGILREMVEEGKITQEEFENTNICNYYRTIDEFKAPFQPSSKVTKAGLHLLSIEVKITHCPYHKRWLSKGGDATKHAKEMIPGYRVWSNHSFFSGLSEKRPEQERRDIVDQFFGRYEQRIAKNPEAHAMDYVHALIVIEKRTV